MDMDRIEITTPEGLNLEMTLAGLGSRAAAAIIDTVIIVAVALVILIPFPNNSGMVIGIFRIATPFLLFFGYHIMFEMVGKRQSPGKRVLGLRVVNSDGSPIGAVDSLIRNLIRLIDFLPAFYLIGIIAVFATTQNQRLGDLAAGVVVVTEPKPIGPHDDPQPSPDLPDSWDVSAVSDEEVAMMQQFRMRRSELSSEARLELATRIALSLDKKVSRPPTRLPPELLIATVLELKKQRD
jgi:uncharacterized RDD family membrane protein YckC